MLVLLGGNCDVCCGRVGYWALLGNPLALFAGWLFGNWPPPPAAADAEVPLGKESPPFGPKLG